MIGEFEGRLVTQYIHRASPVKVEIQLILCLMKQHNSCMRSENTRTVGRVRHGSCGGARRHGYETGDESCPGNKFVANFNERGEKSIGLMFGVEFG